jgi:hypothetical protein
VRGNADVARALHRILPVRRIHRLWFLFVHYCLHLKCPFLK